MTTAVAERADTGALALPELADKINEEHAACESAMKTGLEHALEAGRLLIEAKGLCEHGTWQTWLEDNFRGSRRAAQVYMRVVRRWPEIEAKSAGSALLSLDGAVKLLAAPKEEADDAPPVEHENHPPADRAPLVQDRNRLEQQQFQFVLATGQMLKWAQDQGVAAVHKLGGWLCPTGGFMTQQRQLDLLMTLGFVTSPEPNRSRIDAFGRDISDYDLILDTARHYTPAPFLELPGCKRKKAVVSMCDVAKTCAKHSRELGANDQLPEDPECCGFEGCEHWRPECLFGTIDEQPHEFTPDERIKWYQDVAREMQGKRAKRSGENSDRATRPQPAGNGSKQLNLWGQESQPTSTTETTG